MRLVDDPSKCAPQSQPNETPITLPRTSPRMFCAAKKTGELRYACGMDMVSGVMVVQ